MIKDPSTKQLSLPEFGVPFACQLNPENRWVKYAKTMPWDELEAAYAESLDPTQGRPAKPGRLVIGAVIIKHKKGLSDKETVHEIEESPYLQFFCGFKEFTILQPFAPSLFVEIRKRMGAQVYEQFHQAVIDKVDEVTGVRRSKIQKPCDTNPPDETGDQPGGKENEEPAEPAGQVRISSDQSSKQTQNRTSGSIDKTPSHQGKLLMDATVSEQMIRYPTDLSLLNEAREVLESIIDALYPKSSLGRKPRTYRRRARKQYLAVAKQRRPGAARLRAAVRQQLGYVRRNIVHVENLLSHTPANVPLRWTKRQQRLFWIIQVLYTQQQKMWRTKTKRCDDRIVSIHQPHVRPIKRGKLNKPVEFGAKLSVGMDGRGLAHIDHLGWDAFNEGGDLKAQVEAYKQRYGCYPEVVLADPLYGTRDNRRFLKEKAIRFAGKPLGRAKRQTDANRQELKAAAEKRRQEYRERIPIEGKFGQGKNGYGLAKIRARRQDTSESWIRAIFLVMNLAVLFKEALLRLLSLLMADFLPPERRQNAKSPQSNPADRQIQKQKSNPPITLPAF